MKKKDIKDIAVQAAQLLLAFVLLVLVKDEIVFTLVIAALLLINFRIRHDKNEWLLFLIGGAAGFIIEVVLGSIYRLQYWQQDSLFGVPVWLPIAWGYGFIIIRRMGNLIVKE